MSSLKQMNQAVHTAKYLKKVTEFLRKNRKEYSGAELFQEVIGTDTVVGGDWWNDFLEDLKQNKAVNFKGGYYSYRSYYEVSNVQDLLTLLMTNANGASATKIGDRIEGNNNIQGDLYRKANVSTKLGMEDSEEIGSKDSDGNGVTKPPPTGLDYMMLLDSYLGAKEDIDRLLEIKRIILIENPDDTKVIFPWKPMEPSGAAGMLLMDGKSNKDNDSNNEDDKSNKPKQLGEEEDLVVTDDIKALWEKTKLTSMDVLNANNMQQVGAKLIVLKKWDVSTTTVANKVAASMTDGRTGQSNATTTSSSTAKQSTSKKRGRPETSEGNVHIEAFDLSKIWTKEGPSE